MACPYFVPREIVHDIAWPHPARLPLGAGWTGTCCAASHESTIGAVTPNIADSKIAEARISDPPAPGIAATLAVDSAIIRDCCNLGYATACPHLPVSRDWDAIRFTIVGSAPNQITLCYVCEFAHAPKALGTLTYDLATEVWRDGPATSTNEPPSTEAPANAAAPVTTTTGAGGDARVRRLAASYLHAYRVRRSDSQSVEKSVEQSGAHA